MLRLALKLFACCLLVATPALAQSVCQPQRGKAMTVVGVAANDNLNLRNGAGTDFEIVARLANGTGGLIASGRVRFTRESCAVACGRLLDGIPGLAAVIEADCLARGRIWYEVRTPNGVTGWGAARFLRVGTVAPAPAPGKDVTLRLICRSGETLTVTLRPRRNDALVVTGDGLDLVLARGTGKLEIDYASREFGGISLKGSQTRVNWIGPGQPETLCVPRQ